MSDNTSSESKRGRSVLVAMLAVQVLLAVAIDQALARIWSGTTAVFNLAFPLTLCALVAYFSTLAAAYRKNMRKAVWRDLRWLPIFWVLALLTIGSGGGTLEDTSVALCPVGESQWVRC